MYTKIFWRCELFVRELHLPVGSFAFFFLSFFYQLQTTKEGHENVIKRLRKISKMLVSFIQSARACLQHLSGVADLLRISVKQGCEEQVLPLRELPGGHLTPSVEEVLALMTLDLSRQVRIS